MNLAVIEQLPDASSVTLVVVNGAPPVETVWAALVREALAVELVTWDAFGDGFAQPPSVVLVWLPARAELEVLDAVAAWRRRMPVPTGLLGCAPEGTGEDSERALTCGFDDFVAGRSSPRELAARIRAVGRRVRQGPTTPGEQLRFGRIMVDRGRHDVWIDDRRVDLTAMEIELLTTLVVARGAALTRAELLDRVWGKDDLDVGLRAVDNLILRLRRRIGDDGNLIVTVRGIGFRLADA